MKPLHDLAAMQAGIADGTIPLHVKRDRKNRLIDLLGDGYMEIVKKVCCELQPSDFCGHWPHKEADFPACADVYGTMRDVLGERSEEEYAWYIKLGTRPGTDLTSPKFVLSFHPTDSIRLHDGTELRTTVLGYDEEDDE